MKQKNVLYFSVRICVCILLFFFAASFVRRAARIYVKKTGKSNAVVEFILFDRLDLTGTENGQKTEKAEEENAADAAKEKIDFAALYPFKENSDSAKNSNSGKNKKNSASSKTFREPRVVTKINGIKEKLSTWITDVGVPGKMVFINAFNGIEDFLKWNLTVDSYNPVIKLDNGYLSGFCPKHDVSGLADAVIDFNEFLKKQGIPLFYAAAPYKICQYHEGIAGVRDFSNQNADEFIQLLRQNGIPVLDFREELHRAGMNHYESFFRTDHHWKPETGLWACGVLSDWLNEQTSLDIDTSIFKKENYDYNVYPEWFLGSQGEKVTLAKTSPDDFTLITPKEKYDLTCSIYDSEKVLFSGRGGFEILLDMSQLEEKALYDKNPYATYMYGDTMDLITNNRLKTGGKVLITGDSFTDVVEPFLSLGLSRLDCVDMRIFSGSLETYIEKNGPYDAVVILKNGGDDGGGEFIPGNLVFNFK